MSQEHAAFILSAIRDELGLTSRDSVTLTPEQLERVAHAAGNASLTWMQNVAAQAIRDGRAEGTVESTDPRHDHG
ncbi:hypothetical protein [Prauserella endophytica]|uniref:Uncharacterized protein n=1 Tax=Prauserella endophytica TaxID=1592324 RepID=A0ABY2RW74_9PSEU|nr:hypothetical protein [Prauserella endophytica]TKG63097.1 hypothetical protein FCN18_30465 [Prauserella endophytica]